VTANSISGELRCEDDLQVAFQGDPRQVVITGSFSSAR
jgi:hypothetical protein